MSNNKWKLSPEEKQSMLDSIQQNIENRNKQHRFRLYLTVSAVACIVLLLVLIRPLFSFRENNTLPENLLTATDSSSINKKDIQLVLSNDKTITFEKDADIKYNKQGEITVDTGGEQIKTSKADTEELSLNTLIVPKGKRSSLTLADGTKVWVNSGSALKFPARFDTKREIWVEGEIYIEVQKDKTLPFVVNTSRMAIEVTGTRFNVTAYDEDAVHSVVLVEGGVNVSVNNEKIGLNPDYKLSVSQEGVSAQKVSIYDYISWKDGLMQFSDEPLANILTRLSRYYDIPVSCDEEVRNIKCNGKLVLFDDIEDVLTTIYHTIPIQYTMEDKDIFIKKR